MGQTNSEESSDQECGHVWYRIISQLTITCLFGVGQACTNILISCFLVSRAEDMQQDAIDTASVAMEKYSTEKEIAGFIKKEFDKKYDPTWHCIVGRSFGSYLTHENKDFIFFFLNQFGILLMKAG